MPMCPEAYAMQTTALFESLQEAKALYAQKYGKSVDEPDQEEDCELQDDVPGFAVVGGGVEAQRSAYFKRVEALCEGLQAVKDSYAQRYGESVDEPEPEDIIEVQDGVSGVTVIGRGAAEQREAYDVRISALFGGLQER